MCKDLGKFFCPNWRRPKTEWVPLFGFERVWEVQCYPGSIIPGVCVAALLFPQHSERVRLSPITLSVCLEAKLQNRCHWTVGGCTDPHLPPKAIHSSRQEQLENSKVPHSTAAFTLLHKHINKHTHTHFLFFSSIIFALACPKHNCLDFWRGHHLGLSMMVFVIRRSTLLGRCGQSL